MVRYLCTIIPYFGGNSGLESQRQLGNSTFWLYVIAKPARMIFRYCMKTSGSEASSRLAGPDPQLAVESTKCCYSYY